jgi:hypothetical protein
MGFWLYLFPARIAAVFALIPVLGIECTGDLSLTEAALAAILGQVAGKPFLRNLPDILMIGLHSSVNGCRVSTSSCRGSTAYGEEWISEPD